MLEDNLVDLVTIFLTRLHRYTPFHSVYLPTVVLKYSLPIYPCHFVPSLDNTATPISFHSGVAFHAGRHSFPAYRLINQNYKTCFIKFQHIAVPALFNFMVPLPVIKITSSQLTRFHLVLTYSVNLVRGQKRLLQ